jgi:hypothetical protein
MKRGRRRGGGDGRLGGGLNRVHPRAVGRALAGWGGYWRATRGVTPSGRPEACKLVTPRVTVRLIFP